MISARTHPTIRHRAASLPFPSLPFLRSLARSLLFPPLSLSIPYLTNQPPFPPPFPSPSPPPFPPPYTLPKPPPAARTGQEGKLAVDPPPRGPVLAFLYAPSTINGGVPEMVEVKRGEVK